MRQYRVREIDGNVFASLIMKKLASSAFSARLSSRKPNLSRLHDERLSSHAKVVSVLLATYVTDDIISREVRYLESYMQAADMAPRKLAKKVYIRAVQCCLLYE